MLASRPRVVTTLMTVLLVTSVLPATGQVVTGEVSSLLTSSTARADGAVSDEDCRSRPPIQITGDAMFQLGPTVGVVNPLAEGTAEDPYVIEGWCIEPTFYAGYVDEPDTDTHARVSDGAGASVHIENTSSHVVVRDVVVDGDRTSDWPGVGEITVHPDRIHRSLSWMGDKSVGVEHRSPPTGLLLKDASNVTITDSSIEDGPGDGIWIRDADDTTIENNTIVDNRYDGVDLQQSRNVSLVNNTITEQWTEGVEISDGQEITLVDNKIEGSGHNVHIVGTDEIVLEGNTIRDHRDGVELHDSENITVRGNTIENSGWDGLLLNRARDAVVEENAFNDAGIRLLGGQPEDYQHGIATSNTVNGEPVRYLQDRHDEEVAAPAGQVILVETSNITASGLEISGTAVGVQAAFSEDTLVEGNTLTNPDLHAVRFHQTLRANVQGNEITDGFEGVVVSASNGTVVAENLVKGQGFGSVEFYGSADATIENNTITDVRSSSGIRLSSATDVAVLSNRIAGHGYDGLDVFDSSGIAVHGNNFADNDRFAIDIRGGGDPVDARENWWGHETGPASAWVNDACTGTDLDGDGESIRARYEGGICVEPWLPSPNADAGWSS